MLWQSACNTHSVLDVNSAFGNNSLQFNPQFQALSSWANQQNETNASLNFSDMLASAQAESAQVQDETSSASIMGQPFQSASSSVNFTPAAQFASASSSSLSGALSDSPTPAEQSQTVTQTSANAPDWRNDNSDPAPEASASSANSSDTAGDSPAPCAQTGTTMAQANARVSQADAPGAKTSADATLTAAQTPAAPASGASLNIAKPSAPASGQPAPGHAAVKRDESHSEAANSDLQAPAAPVQKSLVAAPLTDPTDSGATGSGATGSGATGIDPTGSQTRALANHKPLPSSTVTTDQPESVSSAANVKSPDKAKLHKESRVAETGKSFGSDVAGNDSAATASQTDAMANTANTASAADTSEKIAELTPKSHSPSKVDSNSDLAFALKIQGNDPALSGANQASPATSPVKDNSDPNVQIAASAFSSQLTASMGMPEPKAGPKSGSSPDLAISGITGQLNTSSVAAAPAASNSLANANDESAPAEQSAPESAIPDDQPVTIQPVKTVQVQISGADDQKVDLKLVEKSGALTMSVRSSDASLNRALQQNLPDLTTRLSDQQIRAEWWRPDTQQTESSKNSGNSSSGGNGSASQDQGNQSKGNSGQQGGRGNRPPDWLDNLSTSNNSNQNGRQFTWHL